MNGNGDELLDLMARIGILDCSHLVSALAEVGGRCPWCQRLVCKACMFTCCRCNRNLCIEHRSIVDEKPYCSTCYRIEFAKKAVIGAGRFTVGTVRFIGKAMDWFASGLRS